MQLTDSEVSVETCNIAYILIIFIKRKPPFPFFFFCLLRVSAIRETDENLPSPVPPPHQPLVENKTKTEATCTQGQFDGRQHVHKISGLEERRQEF